MNGFLIAIAADKHMGFVMKPAVFYFQMAGSNAA